MEWYLKVLKQYAVFEGRARRKEFWMFFLFNLIFSTIAAVLDKVLHLEITETSGVIQTLYGLAVLIPGLAVLIRRLHDIGNSGWWFFIAFIPVIGAIWLIVLLAKDSVPGANEYGANPKEDNANVDF
ncbi:MAG: DUF805 domain-containing protein [Brumimicrobium sp.]|nr:DUF805 domain-containing protein [Brumimicrobium sp.]